MSLFRFSLDLLLFPDLFRFSPGHLHSSPGPIWRDQFPNNVNTYGMPKQKAGIIIDTFEGCVVDWGVITGPTLTEGLLAYQAGKKLRPIIQQYLTVLVST